jgi:hypothetical protein
MTVLTTHASYDLQPATDRNFLIGATFLLAFLCCAILASLAPDSAASVSGSSWLFFP